MNLDRIDYATTMRYWDKVYNYNLYYLLKSGCFFFLFISCIAFGQTNHSKSVLFVGNSYTYFWNLPQTVNIMTLKDSLIIETRQSTGGGMSLRQHWNQENGLKTFDIIVNSSFDIVVLQDHSMQAITKADTLMYYGKLFADQIKKRGSKIFLFITWARENDPTKQEKITNEYQKLAQEIDAILVPVGPIWDKVRKERPDIKLFDDDGSHPSHYGTYLSSCVFYKSLTGKSPLGLPHRIVSTDVNGDKLYLNIISEELAKYFQGVVDKFEY